MNGDSSSVIDCSHVRHRIALAGHFRQRHGHFKFRNVARHERDSFPTWWRASARYPQLLWQVHPPAPNAWPALSYTTHQYLALETTSAANRGKRCERESVYIGSSCL